MLINSSFKDYYDFALSGIIDIDKSIIFNRELDIKKYKGPNLGNIDYYFIKDNTHGFFETNFYVYVCGNIYKGLHKISYIKKLNQSLHLDLFNQEYTYLDDFDFTEKQEMLSILKNAAGNQPIATLRAFSNVKESYPNRSTGWDNKSIAKDKQFKEDNTSIIMTNEITYKPQIIINDNLKNISFNKVLNAQLIYQEIEMFLANSNSIEKDVVFSDTIKIAQHGFNKQSFRKRKLNI